MESNDTTNSVKTIMKLHYWSNFLEFHNDVDLGKWLRIGKNGGLIQGHRHIEECEWYKVSKGANPVPLFRGKKCFVIAK